MDQESLKKAADIAKQCFDLCFTLCKPGTQLIELDRAISRTISNRGGIALFKNYGNPAYPASCCLSVNDVAVHGVPSEQVLLPGDLLTIDLGVKYNGMCVDAARSIIIQPPTHGEQIMLLEAVQSILKHQISVIRHGISLYEITMAAQLEAAIHNVYIVPELGGHKIGTELHLPPFIPNSVEGLSREDIQLLGSIHLLEGDVVCIEPVITKSKSELYVEKDGWTMRTKNGCLAAHEESCLIVTKNGIEILI